MKYISFILILTVIMQPASANTAAGRVIFSSGTNTATSPAGERRALKQGDIVQAGDKLQTDNGQLQVRFSDSGFLSLKPKSQMVIKEYAFNGKEDGTEKAFFGLLKGSLRAVSGAIGKHNKKAYKYETPVATIGIRGTAFVLSYCNKDCFGNDGSLLPDGLYVNNGEGRVYVENKEGVIDLVRGQFAFVKDIESEPQQITQPPAINEMILEEAEDYDFDYRVTEDRVDEIREDPDLPEIIELAELDDVQSLAFTLFGDSVGIKSSDSPITDNIRTDDTGAVTAFEFIDANGANERFDSRDARLIELRSGVSTIYDTSWGIWEGGFRYEADGTPLVSDPQYLAYMGFANPTDLDELPGSGSATFSVQLDPRANGAVSVQTGALSESFTANIGVNWQTATFTNFDLAATFPDRSDFSLSMSTPFIPVTSGNISLNGNYRDGGGQTMGAFGNANFQFANQASIIGGTFHVSIDGPVKAVGTFLLGDSSVEIVDPLPDLRDLRNLDL